MNKQRKVYYISDSTGVTVSTIGRSVLVQFNGHIKFVENTMPFVDSESKLEECCVALAQQEEGFGRPIVFCTLSNSEYLAKIQQQNVLVIDCLDVFITPLEAEFEVAAIHRNVNKRALYESSRADTYFDRVASLNFTIDHDDGASLERFSEAEVILLGVSRSGKTPTSIYMALQFGIKVANMPVIPEDLERYQLPKIALANKNKLYGLTIDPERLAQVRKERRPDTEYSTLDNCRNEVRLSYKLMHQLGIPIIDTSYRSVEEIAANIIKDLRLSPQR